MSRRLVMAGVAALALWFALQGGEYTTLDIISQRRRIARMTARADSLARVVDSLGRVERKVLRDPATQERIAREEFGMVRDHEILYRFARPDSAGGPTRR